jgi:hypothetical protein
MPKPFYFCLAFTILLATIVSSHADNGKKSEDDYNQLLAQSIGGKQEVEHTYHHAAGQSSIRVDIETQTHVIEGGLDKRSSLDSLQQAIFAAHLTKKKPFIVIYDTDGIEGRYEYRIRIAAEKTGVGFLRIMERDIASIKQIR